MRTTTTLSRRAAAVALAGTLAFGVSACSEDEGTDVDTEVTEGDLVEDADDGATDMATDTGTDMATDTGTDMATDMATEG